MISTVSKLLDSVVEYDQSLLQAYISNSNKLSKNNQHLAIINDSFPNAALTVAQKNARILKLGKPSRLAPQARRAAVPATANPSK